MRAVITGGVVALALGVTVAAAQDSTVKSKTTIDGDHTHAVTMRGCLQQTPGSAQFVLLGGVTASGDDLKSKSTVKTDVDKDNTTVKGKSTTKVDNDKHVATSGSNSSYVLSAREGVDLAAHVGEQVEITAVSVDARKGGDKTAEVTIKDNTKIERDHAPDAKVRSKTKAELPRGAEAQLTAMSVRSLGRSCSE